MAYLVKHFVMPLNAKSYYDGAYDAIMVATTTTTYILLYISRINNIAEVPPVPTPTDLPEFLWPSPALPEHEPMPR